MEIKSLKEFACDYKALIQLWNDAYKTVFPISYQLFERNIINDHNLYLDASFVAYEQNKPIGFILIKKEQVIELSECNKVGWISLFFVKKSFRRTGLGSSLLQMAQENLFSSGINKIHIGRDYHNFFPGLPFDLKQSLSWFIKRGFLTSYDTHDLIRIVDKTTEKLEIIEMPYQIRTAQTSDFPNLRMLFVNNWPTRWLQEFDEYVACGGTGKEYMIALDKEKVCAFCRVVLSTAPIKLIGYSSTWRERFDRLAGIGPLGVDANYRGLHLGYNIVASAVNKCLGESSHIIIDWTNLIDFYRQFGFEIWKSYIYLVKEEK